MLIVLAVLFGAVILATLGIILLRRAKPVQGEKLRVREIWMTAVLGLLLWLEAGMILYYGLTVPDHLITSRNAEINVYIFLSASILLGAAILLYYFVKCVSADAEGVTYVSLLGVRTRLAWNEIDKVSQTNGKRLVLVGKGGEKVTVGGEKSAYKEFVRYAAPLIPPEAGDDVLRALKASLKL